MYKHFDNKSYSIWALNADLFEFRFKRKPKEWRITEVYELYIRASKRAYKIQCVSSKLFNEIVNDMGTSDKTPFKIYHDLEDGTTTEYNFSYSENWSGYGVSRSKLVFSDDKKLAREQKIDFLISNENAYKWGELYYNDQKNRAFLHRIIYGILCKLINNKLQEYFKNNDTLPKEIFKISIGGDEYYVKASGDGLFYKNHYVEFELSIAVEDNIIKM